MHRNVNLTYLISSLSWGRFFLPVMALFYIASEVTLEEFGIILAVFSLATLLFEIPSGMFADKVGRKYSLLISMVCYLIEISILAFGNGFVPFLVAKVISGFGVSLSSGTTESLLYDSLKETGEEDKYKKVVSTWHVWMNVSMAIVFIVGAYLFSIDSKLPAIVSLPFTAIALVLVFFLKEPKVLHRHRNYLSLFKEALSKSLKSRRLQYLYLFTFMPSVATAIVLSLSSVYFEKVGVPVFIIGLLAFISSSLTAWAASSAEGLSNKFSERKIFIFVQVSLLIGIFLMSLIIPLIGVLFYFIIPFVVGVKDVLVSNAINGVVESRIRATSLSINSFFENVGIFLLFPIVARLSDTRSLGLGLTFLTTVIFFVLIIWLLAFRRSTVVSGSS